MAHAMTAEDVRKHVNIYLKVFATLAVLTVVTVAIAEFKFLPKPLAIAFALLVAGTKASLVACYFMHLISERGFVLWVLWLCAIFFLVLLLVPVLTQAPGTMARTFGY